MGLFFQEFEKDCEQKGTEHWQDSEFNSPISQVLGSFNQKTPNGRIISIEFGADDERIFFIRNGRLRWLQLYLTGMEERFSFSGSKRVYEIKLKRKSLITNIQTTDIETFIRFYIHLANFCILTNFQKHFKLMKQLGSGAFSKVYNGQNLFSKEEVALKVFDKRQIASIPNGTSIIQNQITNLEKLRKFNLSPLIETYESQDCVVIVMQKAQAGNMLDYLKEHQHEYNQEMIRLIMLRVLENLDQLHSAGFIHRDIKPQNILFKNHSIKSAVFFGDFGLTVEKAQCECSKIGKMCSGTMGFLAPQILHEHTYDEKCDLFSLGCLFFFLHKGQSLFCGKSQEQIHDLTVNDRIIERKIKGLENISKERENLMKSLLKTNPRERISTKQALEHQYFHGMEHNKPSTGQSDRTISEYINRRIKTFFK